MTREVPARVHEARTSRAQQIAIVATLVAALLLAGCAIGRSMQQTMGGWVDRARGRTPAEGPARTAYATAAGTRVYSEPDADSAVMGVLTRSEELVRYQSESGFAYVKAKGNLSGWVPESQLADRRPRVPQPAAQVPTQPPVEPAVPSDPARIETVGEPATPAGAPTETAPQDSNPEAPEPEPSIFDPY